jgi:hypothetical protein
MSSILNHLDEYFEINMVPIEVREGYAHATTTSSGAALVRYEIFNFLDFQKFIDNFAKQNCRTKNFVFL